MNFRNFIKMVGSVAAIACALQANAQGDDTVSSPAATTAQSSKAANRSLAKKIRRALGRINGLDPSHIYVKVVGGVVTLTGSAATQDQIEQAVKTTQGVSGVTSVIDRLTVRSPA